MGLFGRFRKPGSRITIFPRMTASEYRANLSGMNIFFGAVLGFVLAGAEAMQPASFAWLLVGAAGIVINILYVSASRHRLSYAAMGAILIVSMQQWLEGSMTGISELPPKLQPTLGVWLLLACLVEFLPREAPSSEEREQPDPGD